ncbi:ATP-binding cassette domain-containing protein [Clostridium sp. MCC353]|uniref:ABC-F family ATP-binding cassette domain-containing protein n=1 Tax=Clostridium sp. MCC353 TaxID=2592646 RepID=UPI001C02CFA2|nr:ABC-F family ATP-binding cassette domain-containing protein [Clostridium sp. MCC353]MBT9779454.1 ATP-binding cassette domain-containing protein [Clostridium sp. MCC353]
MLYQITDGTVTLGGVPILSHIDFEIRGNEKIAVVGRNGAGKTTLLRLIAGELELDRDDKRNGPGIICSRKITAGMLSQQVFSDREKTVEEELLASCPCRDTYARERFDYEREYDILFTGLGFTKGDKRRKLSSFSGGEQTKIALIRLLLAKPDVLLLDEPTNHLDLATSEWLEQYLKRYEKAVVMVSHDRFFLDQTTDVVYELAGGKMTRYPGNYTAYRQQKLKSIRLQQKAYERYIEETKRLEELVERFKHKPRKASFARSKKKAMERMTAVSKPEEDDVHIFTGEIEPLVSGSKTVFEAEHLKIGYNTPVLEITMRVRKGQKIGILGANGVGKTTFLKTAAGLIPPIDGTYSLGNNITIGYFDQHSAQIMSDKTVADHFHDLFPALTEKEVRSILGAYLFGGREAGKRVSSLSGGEKSRLVLAELLQSRPNFLILDEPTNHMDIQAKETLESAFQAYTGTVIFVSHDRYFIRQVADAVMIFEDQSVMYYPFGYEHYLERCARKDTGESMAAQVKAEEQALIAGMRAVPKAERHRLREIPEEEAYFDWQLRLAGEKMEAAGMRTERLQDDLAAMREAWEQSEGFWNGGSWDQQAEYERMKELLFQAWEEWNAYCLEWYQIGEEGKLI